MSLSRRSRSATTRFRSLAAALLIVAALIGSAAIPAAPAAEDDLAWTGLVANCNYERLLHLEARGRTLDIATVGSSLTFRGMLATGIRAGLGDPGALVLNAGTPAKAVDAFGLWARHVVVPIARPDVVVIGIASRDLWLSGDNQKAGYQAFTATIGWDFTARGDLDYALAQIAADKQPAAFRAALRRPDLVTGYLADGWDPHAAGYEPPGWRTAVHWDSNCRQIFAAAEPSPVPDDAVSESAADEPPRDLTRGLRQLRRLIRGLERDGVTPVLVNLPVTQRHIDHHPNREPEYDAYRAAVTTIAIEHEILLIDAVEFFASREEGVFRDGIHLNETGARRFSRALGRLLQDPDVARVVCLRCN